MSWTVTLQKRGKGKGMSKYAIGLTEYVLTSEPQTAREIIEAMFEKGQEYINTRGKHAKYTSSKNHSRIPTSKELITWLSKQPDVESARFHNWTNKVVPETSSNTINTSMKYWRL